jgi:hypothetical protein
LVCGTAVSANAQPEEEPAEAEAEEVAPEETTPEADPAPEPPAVDESKPGLVVTGSFFTRYEYRQNYSKIGMVGGRVSELDATAYRARLGLTTTPVDVGKGRSVTIGVTPQASGFWGPSGGLADAGVGLHEAKMRIKGDTNWLDLGRFEMIYGDHFVVGNVGWHETGRSFDGGRLHIGVGDKGAWVEAFLTMITEGSPAVVTPLGAGDQYFTGVYANLGPNFGEGMDLDAYMLNRVWPEIEGGNDLAYESTIGGRYKKKMGKADIRVEAGVQVGKNVADQDVLAFQGEGEVGFKASDQLKVAGQAFYATGDDDPLDDKDKAWDQLFPTAHKWLGLMDIMGGRSNIMGASGKGRYKMSDDLGLALDVHYFMRPQTPDPVDGYAGIEADAWALYKLGKGLGLRGQYSIFVPNETGPLGSDDLVYYMEVQLKFDLK